MFVVELFLFTKTFAKMSCTCNMFEHLFGLDLLEKRHLFLKGHLTLLKLEVLDQLLLL